MIGRMPTQFFKHIIMFKNLEISHFQPLTIFTDQYLGKYAWLTLYICMYVYLQQGNWRQRLHQGMKNVYLEWYHRLIEL